MIREIWYWLKVAFMLAAVGTLFYGMFTGQVDTWVSDRGRVHFEWKD